MRRSLLATRFSLSRDSGSKLRIFSDMTRFSSNSGRSAKTEPWEERGDCPSENRRLGWRVKKGEGDGGERRGERGGQGAELEVCKSWADETLVPRLSLGMPTSPMEESGMLTSFVSGLTPRPLLMLMTLVVLLMLSSLTASLPLAMSLSSSGTTGLLRTNRLLGLEVGFGIASELGSKLASPLDRVRGKSFLRRDVSIRAILEELGRLWSSFPNAIGDASNDEHRVVAAVFGSEKAIMWLSRDMGINPDCSGLSDSPSSPLLETVEGKGMELDEDEGDERGEETREGVDDGGEESEKETKVGGWGA
mmetsp:Transcript_24764/g.44642  ORF Transcript_24764/g.44642 Transcript_24764/m.44642 type:complete len:306 (-) Transcript_24764:110-1027(-)